MTKNIIIILLAVAVAVLAFFLFNRGGSDNYRDVLKAKDETIAAIQRERDALLQAREDLTRAIEANRRKDSALQVLYLANRKNITANEAKYKDIAAHVRGLSKDSLRRAIYDY